MSSPRFSWDINLGHVVTAASVFFSTLGAVLIAYVSIESKLVDHESRLVTLEHTIQQQNIDSKSFQTTSFNLLMDIRDRLSRVEGSLGTNEHPTSQSGR